MSVTFLALTFLALWTASQRLQGEKCNLNTRLVRSFMITDYEITKLSVDGRKVAGIRHEDSFLFIEIWDTVSQSTVSKHRYNAGDIDDVYFSPSLDQYAVMNNGRVEISNGCVIIPEYLYQLHGLAWSPDEKAIAILWLRPSLSLVEVRHATTGTVLLSWPLSTSNGLCWAPSRLISIAVGNVLSYSIVRYDPNGTLVSDTQLNEVFEVVGCNADATVITIGGPPEDRSSSLKLVDMDGNGFTQIKDGPVSTFLGGSVLGVCANTACKVYDTSFVLQLLVTEPVGHTIIGFSVDERYMVTYYSAHVFWWEVQIPHILVRPTGVRPASLELAWVDRDRIMVGDRNGRQEFNVRTGHFGVWYPSAPAAPALCVMQGEIYMDQFHQTVQGIDVLDHQGKLLRRWYLPPGYVSNPAQLSCSYGGFLSTLVTSRNHSKVDLLIWTSEGSLVQRIPFFPGSILDALALYNITHLAVGFGNYLHFWNPRTSEFDLYTGLSNPQYVRWSPDGSWLLIIHYSESSGTLTILDRNRQPAMSFQGIFANTKIASWSPDSNWLVLAGSPPILVCPKLKLQYYLEDFTAASVFWNPDTMEIMSQFQSEFRVWRPTPSITRFIVTNISGVKSPAKIELVGANFVTGPTQTMIRWVDSSTAVPQCIFVHATFIDASTLSLGNISLPDPAMYNVHIRYPTKHPTSPWISSSFQVAATCADNTFPGLSQSGGVTSCVCPRDHYTLPDLGQVKCGACPPHGRCDGTSVVLSEEGYWPTNENPYIFLPCAAGACQRDNQCSPCHQGPLCGLCQPGCGQHGFVRCRSCNPGMDILVLILGFSLWIVLCTIQSLFALGWRNNKSRGNNSAQLAAILVSTTQVHALLLSVDVNVSSLSKTLGFSEESVQAGGVQSGIFSCIFLYFGLEASHIHFVKQVIMLMLPLIGCFVLLICRGFLQWRGVRTSAHMVKVPTVVVWSSLQSALITSLFQTLVCGPINSQGLNYRLKHDPSVACFDSSYWMFLGVVTIPAIILTIIAIPLRIAWLLKYRPSANKSGHLRFLVKSYRMDWWYLVIFYRKVLLSIGVTFTKNPFSVAIILLLAAVLNLLIPPSTAFVVNASETASLMISALIFGVAGAVGVGETSQFGVGELVSVGALSYCIQLGLLVYDRWQGKGRLNKPIDNLVASPESYHTRLLLT